jgi:hypothetical protein
MVSAVDDGVGRVLNSLKKNQINQNTIVFFSRTMEAPVPKMALTMPPFEETKAMLGKVVGESLSQSNGHLDFRKEQNMTTPSFRSILWPRSQREQEHQSPMIDRLTA